MKFKAIVNFGGTVISASVNQIIEIKDVTVAEDLLKAKYIVKLDGEKYTELKNMHEEVGDKNADRRSNTGNDELPSKRNTRKSNTKRN